MTRDEQDEALESVSVEPPMTKEQSAYLKALCEDAGEPFESGLSRAAATQRIEALQKQTGRQPKLILGNDQTDG
jgi:hypothetical protein